MAITTQDIQLYQPEVLDDTDNGGGRMSPNQVVDGELNNLFDDQSRFDRVTGRVSLRKGWKAVISENRNKLLGAHAILLQRALDPLVHVSMFGRDDHTDRRDDAQLHLEQYLAAGATRPYYPWDTQPEGALIVSLLTELANDPPAAGSVLVLSVERGTVNVGMQQFVRCVKVEVSEVTATVPPNYGTKTLKLIDITIDQPLRFDVPGEEFAFNQPNLQKTAVRRTTLAGGKRYYSIHKITEAIDAEDTGCTVESVLTPVVPAATQETGIVDQQIGADTQTLVPLAGLESAATLTETVRGVSIANNAAVILTEHALMPETVEISVRPTGQSSAHQHVLVDDGRGLLVRQESSGGSVPVDVAGTVDYRNGQIIVTGMSVASGTLDPASSTVVYQPAAAVADVQHTDGVEVTLANRGLVWTRTLEPAPQPGALRVEYRALGRWISLRDRGDGTVTGSSGEGAGTINYATGSVNLTLGAEPDIGSHILYGWGSAVHYQGPSGPVSARVPELILQLTELPVEPGSLDLGYTVAAVPYTIGDDGSGALTGGATGTIDYATGQVRAVLTQVPAPGTALSVAYETPGDRYTESWPGASLTHTTANGSITPGSVRLVATYSANGTSKQVELVDNGAGAMISARDVKFTGGRTATWFKGGAAVGTINYSSGDVELDATAVDAMTVASYLIGLHTWESTDANATFVSASQIIYSTGGTPVVQDDSAPIDTLELRLEGADLQYGIVPQSLWLTFQGVRYYDRAGIAYYRDDNGNEIQAGAVNYVEGIVSFTDWETGAAAGTVNGLLVAYGRWPLTSAFWRVDAPRLKAASFQITYTRFDQTVADQATADNAGDIAGAGGLVGTVNYDTGVYALTWTEDVVPELATYNAVAITFLPLDPEIIGLDPVRLSVDGRIPTIQPADVAVLHNTQTTELPNPAVAGQTYETRPYISWLEIRDAENELIPTDRYTWDKVTGDVTMANPLDLDDYTQPLTVYHRIEDMLLVTDAQLSGYVGFNAKITHDYPAETSFLSTALPLGNELQASAFNVFSQAAWTGVWSDALIGSPAVVQYNATVYPIIVTNKGAIRERWRLNFTSVTAYQVIGETVGLVGTGDINTDCSPINPATGVPYMTIQFAGISGGANIGNQIRFNTEAAARPIWFNRCTLAGPLTDPEDRFQVELRGDAN